MCSQSNAAARPAVPTHKFVRVAPGEPKNRKPKTHVLSKLDSIALTKLVETYVGNHPFKPTAEILQSACIAAKGLAGLDDAAVRCQLLRIKRRLDSASRNHAASANKQALTEQQMDQILRFLGSVRDNHAAQDEPLNTGKDWRAIIAASADRLPFDFASRPHASTTLSQMYSELLRGKNKGYIVRAALTAGQLDAAFAAFAAAAAAARIPAAGAVAADLAALALPRLPADVKTRLAAMDILVPGGANVVLAREWCRRSRRGPPPSPSPTPPSEAAWSAPPAWPEAAAPCRTGWPDGAGADGGFPGGPDADWPWSEWADGGAHADGEAGGWAWP
jgi:hypothetical protein